MKRMDVDFASGAQRCAAWYYEPDDVNGPTPLVILAHGLGAVRDMRLDAFAERFAAAGYRALVFDYRHFGASEGDPRGFLDIRRQLDDWGAAIHIGRSIPGVDPAKIVLWGSSFGGGHVLAAGARNGDVAAVIAQCPFTNGLRSTLALGPVTAAKVAVLGIRDLVAMLRRGEPVRVPLAGPPGSTALMNAPDVMAGYYGMLPDGAQHDSEVLARVGLRIPFYRPGRFAAELECPVLFAICDRDSVAPARSARRYARKAKHAEVRRYPVGHFDIYAGETFEVAVADQIDFLQRHVPIER